MTYFDHPHPVSAASLLRDAEIGAERSSAIVRLIIFFALLTLVLTAGTSRSPETFALAVVFAYGLVAVGALILAWRRFFHPLLPYAYVTVEVSLVWLSLLLVSRMLDFPPHMVFAIPASGIVFVVLVHAAMRFRPALVVYAGTLTIAVLGVGVAAMPTPETASPFLTGGLHGSLFYSLLHSRLIPFGIIAVATVTLWATSRRTYTMLQASIDHSRRLTTLSRFFSPRLADRLAREPEATLSSGRRQRCAIMFVDIRKFTEIARDMEPETLGKLLADFRGVVTKVIFEHGGMVDKFIGDAVLAVFGAFRAEADDAERAIRCSIKILASVNAWSISQQTLGKPQVEIGIGVHYGEAFVGAVGDEQMLEFTVLGDAVNSAERLERLTRTVGAALVASRDALEAAGVETTGWAPIPHALLCGPLTGCEAFALPAQMLHS